jgi:hypothetical protein
MPKLIPAAVLSLLLAAALAGPAAAQQAQRFTAMTCDAYKKELSSAITKTRREDAVARGELEELRRQQQAQGQQPVGQGYGMQEEAAPLPIRQYDVMARHRSAAEMACARRDYPEAINEYIQAFNAINVPVPSRLPQPAP